MDRNPFLGVESVPENKAGEKQYLTVGQAALETLKALPNCQCAQTCPEQRKGAYLI